jgi:hypothetical protein
LIRGHVSISALAGVWLFLDRHNPKERILDMGKRPCFNIIRCLFLLGVMWFLMGAALTTAMQVNESSKVKESSMSFAHETEFPMIPPIDAAVPANFETAFFGLG